MADRSDPRFLVHQHTATDIYVVDAATTSAVRLAEPRNAAELVDALNAAPEYAVALDFEPAPEIVADAMLDRQPCHCGRRVGEHTAPQIMACIEEVASDPEFDVWRQKVVA